MGIGRDIFRLGFEISPVILTGGIAEGIPGKMLPIVSITESINFVAGLISGTTDIDLDNFFAHFVPLPGSTLIENQLGNYPYANQSVAGNAIIVQPKTISLKMICPVKGGGGYAGKLAIMTALQAMLSAHNTAGGMYTVATPSFIYTDCVMTSFRDASNGAGKQVQTEYQMDFTQPLLSLEDAAFQFNSLMNQLDTGVKVSGPQFWSGIESTIGDTLSGASASVISAAKNLAGTSLSTIQGMF